MERIVVITNPNAKRNRKLADRRERLRKVIDGLGPVYETRVPEDIQPLTDELVRREPELVCICGGDGTLQHTLTAFIRSYGGRMPPKVLPLRGGTMCNQATCFNVKGSAEAVLGRMVEAIRQGREVKIAESTMMKVDGRYAYHFGAGLTVQFVEAYYDGPFDGPASIVTVTARGIFGSIARTEFSRRLFARLSGRVEADGEAIPFSDFTGILAGTLPRVGMGFSPLYRARERSDRFHIIATGLTPRRLVFNIGRIFTGRPLKGSPHHDQTAGSARLAMDRPFTYLLDGELYAGQDLTITCGVTVNVVLP